MPATPKKTDQVLASARKDLQAQLALVREELSRLGAEESALTQALSGLDGGGASAPATPARASKPRASAATKSPAQRRSSAKVGPRRTRAKSKPTADRVKELEGLLAAGPKSRNELAAAINVSPARVQQLLAQLGSAVLAQPHPQLRGGKLWSLKRSGDGESAAKPAPKRAND